MQKKTSSLLEELQSFGDTRDINNIIENRASNIITSAINLIELMQKHYSLDKAEILERKLLSAIKSKDQERFAKSLRKKHENK
jgi:hypothetical protein